MRDFYFEIEKALKEGNLERLIKKYNGDTNLSYKISPELVKIFPNAFNELKTISKKSFTVEIAFTGIISEKLQISSFIEGKTGDQNMCSWTKGNLLKLSLKKANQQNSKVLLGHTHPVITPNIGQKREYGAICSKIYWTEKELKNFGDSLSHNQLKTGIYKKFGGDYGEMWTLNQNKYISNFSLIMSPMLDQLGVFEVNINGEIVYHPWKIGLL